jgi:hypothetical protein
MAVSFFHWAAFRVERFLGFDDKDRPCSRSVLCYHLFAGQVSEINSLRGEIRNVG